jgi:hypothetical protein
LVAEGIGISGSPVNEKLGNGSIHAPLPVNVSGLSVEEPLVVAHVQRDFPPFIRMAYGHLLKICLTLSDLGLSCNGIPGKINGLCC